MRSPKTFDYSKFEKALETIQELEARVKALEDELMEAKMPVHIDIKKTA